MESYKTKLYNEYLKSVQNLDKLEIERKLILFFIIFTKTIIYLVLIIFIAYFINLKNNLYALVLFSWLFGVSSLFGNLAKIYKRKIKNKCLPQILKCFDFIKDDSNDLFTSLILKEYIKHGTKGNITPKIDDRYTGTYNNVKYRIAEIRDIHIRGYQDVYPFWQGVFIEIQFNKEIKAPIYVFPKSEKGYTIMIIVDIFLLLFSILSFCVPVLIFSLICIILQLWSSSKDKFKKVDLEDVRFSKLYNVETTDQVEARYILTTAFMDRINNLKRVFNSKDIRIFFENNKMTIAIRTTKDLFEIGDINCSIHDFKQINQFYEEITAIIRFIEHFKLTNRTGL